MTVYLETPHHIWIEQQVCVFITPTSMILEVIISGLKMLVYWPKTAILNSVTSTLGFQPPMVWVPCLVRCAVFFTSRQITKGVLVVCSTPGVRYYKRIWNHPITLCILKSSVSASVQQKSFVRSDSSRVFMNTWINKTHIGCCAYSFQNCIFVLFAAFFVRVDI